jgi:predicted O-linked N-acetylglucosamine transferase (SPINDLY family)
LDHINREKFETYVLRIIPSINDEITASICAAADHTIEVDCKEPLAATRQRLAELQLDILFYQDIGMEPMSYFLSFARLAPVQCVSFGHPNTTGVPTMDYFVSNDLYESDHSTDHYSERLFLLRDLPTLAYYYRPEAPPGIPGRSALGLPEEATIYLCPQTLHKFHPDFDGILRAILERDPRGRIVLISGSLQEWTETLQRRIRRTMTGVADRIAFLPQVPQARFMCLLAASDVMLDTLHFNGQNSSLEALALGLPVVTLPTQLQRGRHTQAMYVKMGMRDCIAENPEQYVDIAVRLGTDMAFRDGVRARILERNHVLFEDLRVVREFERFFETALTEAGVTIAGPPSVT